MICLVNENAIYQYDIAVRIFRCFRYDGEYTSDFSCSEDSDSTSEVHIEDEGESNNNNNRDVK